MRSSSEGTTYSNSNVTADKIVINTGNDATFSGANVNAQDALTMDIGGDLVVESLQDSEYSDGKSLGISVGFGNNSVSGGFNVGNSDSDSLWVNDMTELTGGTVDINVGGKTAVTGAVIAAGEYDENGNFVDNGNLTLATDEFEYNDLHDYSTSSESGFGFSTSVGGNTDKGIASAKPQGSTTISMTDKGSESEQETRATIGGGSITISNGSDAEGLNRDVSLAQEITKDLITGALDGSVTIDNRMLSGSGWDQIIDQHENFVDNLETAIKDASVAPIAMGGIGYGTIGTLLNPDGQIIIGENGNLHFVGNIFGPEGGAINLGGAISYYGQSHPDDIKGHGTLYGANDNLILGYHEEAHTNQWREKSSPVFLYEWIIGGGPNSNNPIENDTIGGANSISRDRMINEGIYDRIQNTPVPGWTKDTATGNYNYIPGNAGIYK